MAAFLRFSAPGVRLMKGKLNLSLIAAMLAFWTVAGGQVLSTANADEYADLATPADKQHEYIPDEVLVILADDVNANSADIDRIVGGVVKKQLSIASTRKNKRSNQQIHKNPKQVLRAFLDDVTW